MQLVSHIRCHSKERFGFGQRSCCLLGVGGGGRWNRYKCIGQCAFPFGVYPENSNKGLLLAIFSGSRLMAFSASRFCYLSNQCIYDWVLDVGFWVLLFSHALLTTPSSPSPTFSALSSLSAISCTTMPFQPIPLPILLQNLILSLQIPVAQAQPLSPGALSGSRRKRPLH